MKLCSCSFGVLYCLCKWFPDPDTSVKPVAIAATIPFLTSKCAKSASYKRRALINVPLCSKEKQEQCGLPDQPAAHRELLPNEVQGGKTEVPAKCVTLSASSLGTWFPTDSCFKAGVQRGVKFLLWRALSPVDSQVSTRVALPP